MDHTGFQARWWLLVAIAAFSSIICQTATTAMAKTSSNETVVEEVTGWLRIYSDGTVERLTPEGAEPFTAIVPPYAEPRDGVTVHDVPTGRGVDVRLYLPEPIGYPRRPVPIHFHGGAFCVSRPSWALYHNFYAPLSAKINVAGIVSVYLPLAPEHRLPAAIEAGHDALLWLRDVARGNNTYSNEQATVVESFRSAADFSRVFLIGDSSGGNLVHLVAARAGESPGTLHPVRLAGGVLLNPGFAREQKSRSELENPPSLFLTTEIIDKLLVLGLPLGTTKDSPCTSPELTAKAAAHVRMPPMLLIVAEKDLLHDPQVDYGKAMVNEGKLVKTVISRGDVAHIFYLNFLAVNSENLTAQRTTELVRTIKSFIIGRL